ncbi:MAG: sugar porter family MFS transporter [Gammaproteobacteria bacterium]|nr:MAG: sugar porter family MFS transporter [Gammaproteobacteria bacterium]
MAVYLVCAIAALAGLLFGFDTGIISGALLFIEKGFTLTTVMKELIVSSVLLGAMAGSLCSGQLTDRYGRKPVILIISSLFIIGTLIASLAPNVQTILIGRLCIGIAIGIGSYTAPLYIAEVAPLELRGGLVSFNQLAITIGIMCSYFINYLFTNTEASWRWMFLIGIIPAVLLFFGMFFLPESPRWLVKQKKLGQAKETLRYLRANGNVDHELSSIEKSLSVHQASFSEIMAPWIRPVLFLGIMLGFLQQVTGINTIIYYAPTIFQMTGFQDTSTSILATVGIGIVNVLATIFAVVFLDKLGRRVLLLTGLVGMFFSLAILSLAFQWNSDSLRWIAVLCTFTYVICFAFSLGAMLWLLASEIFPLNVRGIAMSIAIFSGWLWNFVVSATFLSLLNSLGPANTFMVYAVMCVIGFIFCYYKVPETKGVSLEAIEANIRRGLPLREIGQPIFTPELASENIIN